MSGEGVQSDDLNKSFMDPVFLQQFALSRDNALEYFCRSPFYDPLSNNETLRMQGAGMSHLQGMVGVEFAMDARAGEDSRLYLIKKQRRSGPKSVHVLSMYYILDGTVYQSPNLLHLLMTKYNKITQGLAEAFTITADCADFSLSGNKAATGIFSLSSPSSSAGSENEGRVTGKKRQKITDCRDFPSFSSCVGDMESFLKSSSGTSNASS